MLSRFAQLAFIIACVTTAQARSQESKLVGKWLWHGIDAEAVLTFERGHTYVHESTGFDFHESKKATWRLSNHKLVVSWPDGHNDTYSIVRLTSDILILHSVAAGRERFSRVK